MIGLRMWLTRDHSHNAEYRLWSSKPIWCKPLQKWAAHHEKSVHTTSKGLFERECYNMVIPINSIVRLKLMICDGYLTLENTGKVTTK